jgi:hypothetical protein
MPSKRVRLGDEVRELAVVTNVAATITTNGKIARC